MMRFFYFFIVVLFSACTSNKNLMQGKWSGNMTPMNHPEMNIPVQYSIANKDGETTILLEGPNNSKIWVTDIAITKDSLFFNFVEPEENVPLNCRMGKMEIRAYEGRCTDSAGKWARFTMMPPVDVKMN